MSDYLTESNMDFEPLFKNPAYEAFYIEKSSDYQEMNQKSSGVKSVEFLAKRKNEFCFIEAKETFANMDDIKNPIKLEDECNKLYEKFHHSFLLFASKELKISPSSTEFSFLTQDVLESHKLKFYLIIKDSNKDRCGKIRTKLMRGVFKPLTHLLDLDVRVIPGETARKFDIIS